MQATAPVPCVRVDFHHGRHTAHYHSGEGRRITECGDEPGGPARLLEEGPGNYRSDREESPAQGLNSYSKDPRPQSMEI